MGLVATISSSILVLANEMSGCHINTKVNAIFLSYQYFLPYATDLTDAGKQCLKGIRGGQYTTGGPSCTRPIAIDRERNRNSLDIDCTLKERVSSQPCSLHRVRLCTRPTLTLHHAWTYILTTNLTTLSMHERYLFAVVG
jgi:hypothetical protein